MAAPRDREVAFAALFCFLLFFTFVPIQLEAKSSVIQLDDENWSQMLDGEWMVEFYAPWCPACKGLQKVWEDFSSWSDDLGIKVGQIDVTANQGCSGRFMVTALPTIYHVKDGHFRQYRGSRTSEEFITFIEEKKWTKVDEVSWFWKPNSFQMSVVSYFYKLSMVLRSVHNQLVDVYGFPNWASLVVFGLATILIGAILGLLLVCVVDVVYPPIPHIPLRTPQTSTSKPPEKTPDLIANEEEASDGAGSKSSKAGKTKKNDEDGLQESPSSRQLRKRKPQVTTDEK